MNKFTKVALVAVLLCFGAVILSLGTRSRSARPFRSDSVSVAFTGVTTNATGEASVLFRVRNGHDRSINYFVAAPQIQKAEQWPDRLATPIRNPTLVFVGSHREVNFSIPAPGTSEPWRVPVVYLWAPSRYQVIVEWLSVHVLLRLRGTPRVEQEQAFTFTIFSPTVRR
jgi:hypothetical protein